MKINKRTLLIVAIILLSRPAFEICKTIYNDGVKDGKLTSQAQQTIKK